MVKKILYLLVFMFCLPILAVGEEVTSPVISVGTISTKWKGFLNIPFWTESIVSFTGITPVTLPKEATSFKFGFNWHGENETRASQKCTIVTRVEVESFPNSGTWNLLFEESLDMISRGGVAEETPIATRIIYQEKPEVRYKIMVETIMAAGQKTKPNTTHIIVCLTSKAYTTYTSIPIIPITILHDPNGDESYTAIQPQTCISHLLNINIAGVDVAIENQKELLLDLPKAKIKITPAPENKNTLKIDYIPDEVITSAISKDPCLIGPGLGDTYVLIKDLPIRVKFSKAFTPQGEEMKSFSFCVVSPQEAGLSPKKGLDVVLIPAAALRSYDNTCPIFGTWEKLDIDNQMRQQLIEMNIGWDNSMSESEKNDVVDIGDGYLNFKEQTLKKYTSVDLNKVSFYSEMTMDPYFASIAGMPISTDKILSAITLNELPINKTISMDKLVVTLEDDDRQNIPGDFFTYQIYQDRRFGSLLFITKDDKTKPATLDSLHTRSFSSNPKEYWTENLNTIPVEASIYGLVTSTTGERVGSVTLELKLNDKVTKTAMSKSSGNYTITGLLQGNEYILVANVEGYKTNTIKISPSQELSHEINIVLEKIPPEKVEIIPVEKEVIAKELPAPPTPKAEVLPPAEEKSALLPPPAPEKIELAPSLLTNGDFASGLKGWKLVKVGAGKQMYAKVVKNDFTYPHTLEIKRTGSMGKYGEMGIIQIVNKDVSKYTQLVLKADVKVINSTLESDGKKGGAYPIEIQITYSDAKGKVHSWRHGFLYAKKINYPQVGEKIPQDKWFTYISNNLLEQKPRPAVIKEIKLSGRGFGFHSRVTDVQLVWSKEPQEAKPEVKELPPISPKEEMPAPISTSTPTFEVPSIPPEEEKPIQPPSPEHEKVKISSLLTNGDFASGLKGWKLVKVGAGKQMYAKVVKNDFTYPHTLEIKRTGSMGKYGEIGIIQIVNKDVSKYTQLVLRADVKVIDSTLESDGKRGGAYPVMLQINYTDAGGKIHSWRHGFLYAQKINYPQVGEKIPQDKWFSYTSINLMELTPKPVLVKDIKLSGTGWGFHSRMANVKLIWQ